MHSLKNVFICVRHFHEEFLKKNEKRSRLAMEKNPVPTILPGRKKSVHRRKEPAIRIFQEDQLDDFKRKDATTDFSNIDESYLNILEDQFHFSKQEKNVTFYKLEENDIGVPEVKCSIRIDTYLRVQLFYKESQVPLQTWCIKGRNNKLTSKSMLRNFPLLY